MAHTNSNRSERKAFFDRAPVREDETFRIAILNYGK